MCCLDVLARLFSFFSSSVLSYFFFFFFSHEREENPSGSFAQGSLYCARHFWVGRPPVTAPCLQGSSALENEKYFCVCV
jgi:hypothetical protein